MKLETVPNEAPSVRLYERHTLPLPQCCPVSGNPRAGSEITISYRAETRVLEVYHLAAYLRSFVGGRADGTRSMETMIQRIAAECSELLGVRVRVRARLILDAGRMDLLAEGCPTPP